MQARPNLGESSIAGSDETSSTPLTVPLHLISGADRPLVGGKAANLGLMIRAKLPVPAGFCVTSAAFRQFFDACSQGAEASWILSQVPTAQPHEAAQLSDALLTYFQECALPTRVQEAVLAAWRAQGQTREYAVRSSATVEDAFEHSFAGQFDSCLNVRGAEPLLTAIKKCWLSLFSARALAYFAKERLPTSSAAMAVLIQDMVPADAAGVIFTVDPVSGLAERMVIEGVAGLGDRLVSGQAVPDTVVLDRPTLRVIEPGSETAPSCLSESLSQQIGKLALDAEALFGWPVDIEWATKAGEVFLLQARAVTGINQLRSREVSKPSTTCATTASPQSEAKRQKPGRSTVSFWEDRQVWTNMGVGDVVPDVMTPATWSVIQQWVGQLAPPLFRLAGAEISAAPIAGSVGGRLYFNVNTAMAALKPFGRMFRGSPRPETMLGGVHWDRVLQSSTELPDENLPDLAFGWTKYLLTLPRIIQGLIAHSPRRADAWTVRFKAANDARIHEDYTSLSTPKLSQHLQRLREEGFCGFNMIYLITQGVSLAIFEKACRDWLRDPDLKMGYRLFSGLGGVPEAEAGLDLWRLALLANSDPETQTIVLEEHTWSSIRARLESSQSGRRFLDAWQQFMADHGHHCRGELELYNQRWSETPDYILGVVRNYLTSSDQADPLSNHQRLAREREGLSEQCRNRLKNPIKRWIFQRALRRAQKLVIFREEAKNQGVRLLAATRRLLLELGLRLAHEGILGERDDIFFLELDEVGPVVGGHVLWDVRDVIAARRKDYERNLAFCPPPVVFGRFDPSTSGRAASDSVIDTWQGIAVFPGVVTARARVILRTNDHDQLLPGEILVAPFTDPAWTPYFVTAAAVVMDQGGILSHGSIVAREYGLPCVTNVGSATKHIQTGDMIKVDGDRGEVTLLK